MKKKKAKKFNSNIKIKKEKPVKETIQEKI